MTQARVARWLLILSLPVAIVLVFVPGVSNYFGERAEPYVPQWMRPLRVDDLTHFFGAACLTMLLAAARPLGTTRPWSGAVLSILFVAALGPVIEWAQVTVGRQAELSDLLSHEAGVAAFVLLWLVAIAIVRVARVRGLADIE